MEPLALLLLALGLQLDLADAGGHGKKHHDHLNIHVPKFIHHDFHTKVITIHHHHHKPKKQHHHHHHHHHHKPHHHVPHHHYHHKKHTTLKTTSVSKGSHGHHGHHHHGHHGHHGHHHGHHHHDTGYQDQPVYQHVPYSGHHDPTHDISTDYVPPSYDDHFESSYTPLSPSSVPSFDTDIPQPRIRGYTHTVKQTKVFGSDPHNLPQGHAAPVSGYEVTEAVADDEDSFSSLNSLQQSFPASYGLVRNLAPEMSQGEAFPAVPAASPAALTVPVQAHDPFAESPVEAPQLPSSFAPATADTSGFDDAESFVGSGPGSAFAADEDRGSGDSPVSFAREGGLSQTYHTSGQQTIVY